MNNYKITLEFVFTSKDDIAHHIRDDGMLFTVLSDVLDIHPSQIREVQKIQETQKI
jgi:hypothetical protein